jgi:hypothetical protein
MDSCTAQEFSESRSIVKAAYMGLDSPVELALVKCFLQQVGKDMVYHKYGRLRVGCKVLCKFFTFKALSLIDVLP